MRSFTSFTLLVLMWAAVFSALALAALGHIVLPFVLLIIVGVLGVCV